MTDTVAPRRKPATAQVAAQIANLPGNRAQRTVRLLPETLASAPDLLAGPAPCAHFVAEDDESGDGLRRRSTRLAPVGRCRRPFSHMI
jgi:hypothetical protein